MVTRASLHGMKSAVAHGYSRILQRATKRRPTAPREGSTHRLECSQLGKPMPEITHRIFFSCARSDAPVVLEVANALRKVGQPVWLDQPTASPPSSRSVSRSWVLRPTDLAGVARRGLAVGLLLASGAACAACDRAGFVVAIDPGHMRASPGATSARGMPEVRFNEVLARRVLASLQAAGFSAAFLTHHDQAPVSLDERAQRANQRAANLFVSIHHDSAQPHRLSTWVYRGRKRLYTDDIRGHSLFVSKKNGDAAGSLRFAQLLGARLRQGCFVPTLHHAQKIPGESRELLDEWLGIYRFDELVVLKSTRMPALLFEAGVIVNRDEERLLRSPRYQKKLAAALTEAVVDFCAAPRVQPAAQPDCR